MEIGGYIRVFLRGVDIWVRELVLKYMKMFFCFSIGRFILGWVNLLFCNLCL